MVWQHNKIYHNPWLKICGRVNIPESESGSNIGVAANCGELKIKGEHVNVDPLSAASDTDNNIVRERCEDATSLFRN